MFVGLSASPCIVSCLFHVAVVYVYVCIYCVVLKVCRCFCFGDAKVEIIFGLCKKKDDFLLTFLSTPYLISRVCACVVCFSPFFCVMGFGFMMFYPYICIVTNQLLIFIDIRDETVHNKDISV